MLSEMIVLPKPITRCIVILTVFFLANGQVVATQTALRGLYVGKVVSKEPESDQVGQAWAEALRTKLVREYSGRDTFLIVPVDQKDIEHTLAILNSFLDMYSDPEIPEEFAWVLPSGMIESGIRRWIYQRDLYGMVSWESLIPSLLLTMAHQQGYRIEHVTSSYVILAKPVYEEEERKWEDRIKEYEEKNKSESG